MTIEKFLSDFANQFPNRLYVDRDRFVNRTRIISLDYDHGHVVFFDLMGDVLGVSISCESMLSEPDYLFVWENLVSYQEDFVKFYNDHKIYQTDLQSVSIDWNSNKEEIGNQTVICHFTFYNGDKKNED